MQVIDSRMGRRAFLGTPEGGMLFGSSVNLRASTDGRLQIREQHNSTLLEEMDQLALGRGGLRTKGMARMLTDISRMSMKPRRLVSRTSSGGRRPPILPDWTTPTFAFLERHSSRIS